MDRTTIDAFLLYNAREQEIVETIDTELLKRGISTFLWNRDIRASWKPIEDEALRNATTAVVFLGARGWGPEHLEATNTAAKLKKRLIPVQIGTVTVEARAKAGKLFEDHFYLDMRKLDAKMLDRLADEIREPRSGKLADGPGRPAPKRRGRAVVSSVGADERESIVRARVSTANEDPFSVRREARGGDPAPATDLPTQKSELDGSGRALEESGIPSLPSWLQQLLYRNEISDATSAAVEILNTAVHLDGQDRAGSGISTTRLLIAVMQRFSASPITDDDSIAVQALVFLLQVMPWKASYEKLQTTYLAERSTQEGQPSQSITQNVEVILRNALSVTGRLKASEALLSADGLVVALLKQPNTGMATRLNRADIFLPELRSALLDRLQGTDPDRIELWRAVLEGPTEADPSQTPPRPAVPGIDVTAVPGVGSDDPWRDDLADKLDVEAEAKAFARVAASRAFSPPLAFGIFGDWGSGKSFFMRLIHQHVITLADAATPEGKSGLFHEHIAQIRFNAWHYAETNLWASLVDHIFSELDRWLQNKAQPDAPDAVFGKLSTARELTLDSAERLMRRRREQKAAT